MNSQVLGHRVYAAEAQAHLTTETEKKLLTVIDAVTASKQALCDYLRANPEATIRAANAFISGECSAISAVNDHFVIGIPMNSFRFTLRAAAYHYFNTIVPEITHVPFRCGAFQRFIREHEEVLLVFPEVNGLDLTVGDLKFSVNRLNATPTFVQFVLKDLSSVRLFYTLEKSSIARLSEYVA